MKKIIVITLFAIISCVGATAQTTITVNTSKENQPISKYIYGQFIEHLGKSVYGGLWAEMILDRKFYFPVTDIYDPWGIGQPDSWWGGSTFPYLKASPWMVKGAPGTVNMDSIAPYTGKYAVCISLSDSGTEAGISHPEMAFLKDSVYSGHIVLSGTSDAFPVIVRLVSQSGDTISQSIAASDTTYTSYPLNFVSTFTDSAKLEIVSKGKGKFTIGIISLMPSNNIDGWRFDVVNLLKELNSPIYRWPGGNFVSGYDWRDGIGDRDKRAARKNPAWTGIEPNDVGIHEFMNLMDIIHSEPFLALNMGLGTVEDAVAEVEYCNGDTTTTGGKIRKENGHADPFNVKYWALGNEMFGSWQLGNMPIEDYEAKHIQAAEGIRKVDSTAVIVAVGDVGSNWSSPMLRVCGDYMNLISEHKYCKEGATVLAHTSALANEVKSLATAHRSYRKNIPGLAEKDIRIAMDEYNYWYGPNPYGQLGVIYKQKDALGVANALHEMFKNSDLFFMANYAQTVNVLGCIKTTGTASSLEATALPLILYHTHFGTIPAAVTGSTASLNVSAAFTGNKDSLTISAVNSLATDTYLKFNIIGAEPLNGFFIWTIRNSNPEAFNEPGKDPNIAIQEEKNNEKIDSIKIPGYSIVMVKFPIKIVPVGIESMENKPSVQLQNYPNPFTDKTTIEFEIHQKGYVKLSVFSNDGKLQANLVDRKLEPGNYKQVWDASAETDGVYYCSLKTGHHSKTNTMVKQ
jgi:alpha-L-arabinofuranosidase